MELGLSGNSERNAIFAIRFGVVQPRQQNTFHYVEDPGVNPNAECQSDHSNEREPGISPQLPQSIAKIMHETIHSVRSNASQASEQIYTFAGGCVRTITQPVYSLSTGISRSRRAFC